MKIDLDVLSDKKIESTTGAVKMRLSENAETVMFQILTKNIYSNSIGSIVREITSNCFDSHVEANTNFPVVIRKNYDKMTNQYSISFIDFGVGMSPDRIYNIYGVYFESTKRDTNDQIGGFGVGAKTPLAYRRSLGFGEKEFDNSFNVITVFDNIKYTYLIYEGSDSPLINLQYEEFTKEGNGTEIRVPALENDLSKFEKEMIRQLYYFENIIFEGFDYVYDDGSVEKSDLTNEYQIVRGKNFLFRGTKYSDYMHICLGRVAYPIDYELLGINRSDYRIPIALKLEIGDINVNVSREAVDYSEGTINMLLKKLEEAKDEIKELLAKQYLNVVSLEDYIKVRADFGKLRFSNGESINVGSLISKKDVEFTNFKYSNIPIIPEDKNVFKFFFESKLYGKKPKRNSYRRRYRSSEPEFPFFDGGYDDLIKHNANVFYCEGEFTCKILKQAYLKSIYGTFFVITEQELMYAVRKDIADLFNISLDKLTDDNGHFLPIVETLLEMQKEYFEIVKKHCTNYMNVDVPDSFKITRQREMITSEMRNTTISARLFNEYGRANLERIKLDQLFKFKEPIYYCTKESEYAMRKAIHVFGLLFDTSSIISDYNSYQHTFNFPSKKRIMFIMLSTNNIKYLAFCKDARPINTIYNTLFYRKVDMVSEYFQTAGLIQQYKELPTLYKLAGFYKISQKWYNKVKLIKEFMGTLKYVSTSLNNNKIELSRYFNTDGAALTPAQKKIEKYLQEVQKLEELNCKTLSYISLPYGANDTMSDQLIDILKKIMVF